jgi:hypothetical protein|tara:strand:+ start:1808 stop:2539 length:732 start_codon:yes stop_codon:yes gene_type:complete
MKKIKSLKGKTIAIVGLGKSWFDYNLAKSHGVHFDEVWAINGVGSVIYHDRVFMMDPPSRFLDTEDAGGQTDSMAKLLKEHEGPIYTCELDDRCPGLVEYPIKEVIEDTNCYYLNNTVAYAIAFAYWNEVSNIKLFGIDFSYKGNLHFAEAGRGCVEFWLSKCIEKNIQVEVASSSGLLDTDVPAEQKLYGYHRLADPLIVIQGEDTLKVSRISEFKITKKYQQPTLIDRTDNHLNLIEPNKW